MPASPRGAKTPIQTGGRWVVERTNSLLSAVAAVAACCLVVMAANSGRHLPSPHGNTQRGALQ